MKISWIDPLHIMGDFNGDFYFSINYMKFQLKQNIAEDLHP